jgi:hypothetical protein
MKNRYDGKPLVMLLEHYVLWSIGELPEVQEKTLLAMTPMLQSTYSTSGTWQQVIASVMQFPVGLPTTLRGMWSRNLELARKSGTTLTPQQFAEMIVDDNFPI